jgi:protein-disulfide isomerase
MTLIYSRTALFLMLPLLFSGGGPIPAQTAGDWQKVTEFAGLDESGLSAEHKRVLLAELRTEGCNCGCTMKIAECRVKDPKCGRSRGLAALVVRELREGKGAAAIHTELEHRMNEAPPMLDEPVPLSINGAPVKGPATAKITLVEFSDFQCPYCAAAIHRLDDLLAKHPQDIRLIFKQFPLDIHSDAALAAEAALAAHAQGKFWPMHDKLYANFRSITREKIFELAKEVGLDQTRFAADLNSGKYKSTVQKELAEGERAGVSGTPTLFVNGKHFNGPVEVPILEQIVQTELKSAASTAKALPRSQ